MCFLFKIILFAELMLRILVIYALLYSVQGRETQIVSTCLGSYVLQSPFGISVFVLTCLNSKLVTSHQNCAATCPADVVPLNNSNNIVMYIRISKTSCSLIPLFWYMPSACVFVCMWVVGTYVRSCVCVCVFFFSAISRRVVIGLCIKQLNCYHIQD